MRPLTHTSGLAALILILASALLPLSSDRAGDGSEEAAGSLPAPGYAPSGAPAAGGQPVSRSGGGGSRGIPGSGGPVGFDPLVLDLDGNGVELAARKRGKLPVLFDHDGDGILAGTGWPAPKDAFLARDLDGDGQIGRGAELFGSQTPNSGGGRCADGFAALAQEDADGSGLVDSGDPGWASLRLWRDLDGDGETDEGELSSLGDLGIAALKTTPEYAGLRDAGGGNAIAALGTYLKKDGSPGALADAVLFSDTRMRRFREAVPVPDDVKEGLPNARGSGMVRDLHEAAALSPEVRRHLEAFAGSGRRSEQRAILADLLTAWADTSPQARTLDEHARGRYEIRYQRLAGAYRHRNITDAAAARDFTDDERNPGLSARFRGLVAEWNRKIHVLEAFYGHYFYALPEELGPGQELQWSLKVFPGGGPPVMGVSVGSRQMDLAYQAYDDLFERIYRDLLFQSRFRELSDLIDVRLTQNPSGVRFDMTAVEASFRELMAEDTYNGLGYLLDYSRTNAVFSLLSDWNGLKLARDTLLSLPPDRRMLDFCRRSGVSVYGTRNFTPDGGGSPDFMIGGEAAERLSGGGGADALFGEGGPDVLRGGEGDDSLFGGEGNDRLLGEAGDDILDGGPGDDLLAGGAGADIYVFGRGYGDDVAEDHAEGREGEDDEGVASCGGEGRERIRLAGLAPEDVTFGIALSGKRHDLSVRVRDTGETLTVRGGA
ncbi:MAG: hypothetical protein LBW85_11600 [Deltaproteobacteria bacterium]|jgi:hypothetical protein|nr:hypothetical protein [Deltaproteobacteria bacterium]